MLYILRKLLFLLVTIWAAVTVNFVLPRLMPGDPAQVMISKYRGRLNPSAIRALEIAFGINTDKSIYEQYIDYIKKLLKGDFGISVTYYPSTVSEVLSQAFPWTIGLVGVSTFLAFSIGTILGIKAAWKRGGVFDTIVVPFGLFMNSVPYFWLALVVVYLFAFKLGWFPLSGAYSISIENLEGIKKVFSIVYHAILPAVTIIITASGGWMLTMRNNMIAVLNEDFILFAYAKGLPEEIIEIKYAARNAILPSFTGFAMAIGFVVSGALLTEIVFSYPGVGYMLYQAVLNIDYPLMQAIFLIITLTVLIANFIADMAYVLLDPRVRTSGGE